MTTRGDANPEPPERPAAVHHGRCRCDPPGRLPAAADPWTRPSRWQHPGAARPRTHRRAV